MLIKYNKEDFKSLIIYYNNKYIFGSRCFKLRIKSGSQIMISDITVLLFMNMKYNTVIGVDYINNYLDRKINLNPKLNYSIIFISVYK